MLQQGVTAACVPAVASQQLPPPRQLLLGDTVTGQAPFAFVTPEDRSRQATQRERTAQAPLIAPLVPHQPRPVTDAAVPLPIPRTTAWRRKKAEAAAAAAAAVAAADSGDGQPQQKMQRTQTQYICVQCGQPKRRELGHRRFGNVSFCSAAAGKSADEWLAEMKDAQERSALKDTDEQSAQGR